MQNDLHDNDPRTIWQNQFTEASRVNLILIRQKARELQRRARRRMLTTLTVPFAVAFFYVFSLSEFPHLRELVHSLFMFALVWSLAGVFFLSRGKQPGAMSEDAGFSTGIEFCRQTLERQRDYVRRILLWSFGPIVLAISTLLLAFAMIAGTEFFAKAMPLTVLALAWIIAYLLTRVRHQRSIQREISELSHVERENTPTDFREQKS